MFWNSVIPSLPSRGVARALAVGQTLGDCPTPNTLGQPIFLVNIGILFSNYPLFSN